MFLAINLILAIIGAGGNIGKKTHKYFKVKINGALIVKVKNQDVKYFSYCFL